MCSAKMKKDGNQWSSMDEVLNSFNNVSLIQGVGEGSDLYRSPSPPKHRISPSQLEMLDYVNPRDRLPSPDPPPVISRGRGRIIQRRLDSIIQTPRARDLALLNHIRSTKSTSYRNADIEAYYNNNCVSSEKVSIVLDSDIMSEDVSQKEETENNSSGINSPDQVSVSSLRADASDFYPPGVEPPNPVELSECLAKLSTVHKPSSLPSPKKSPCTHRNGYSSDTSYHNETFKRDKLSSDHTSLSIHSNKKLSSSNGNGFSPNHSSSNTSSKNDSHIGFASGVFDSGSEEDDNDRENSIPTSISSYSSSHCVERNLGSTCNSESNEDAFVSLKELESPVSLEDKNTESNNVLKIPNKEVESDTIPKQKRVIKNALLSGLMNQPKTQNLMKPVDFLCNSSTFKPIKAAESSNSGSVLSKPYNFMADPTICNETRELIRSLTLTSPSSSSSSPSSVSITQISSSTSSPVLNKNCPKPFKPKPYSLYNFSYNEEDFPPLS